MWVLSAVSFVTCFFAFEGFKLVASLLKMAPKCYTKVLSSVPSTEGREVPYKKRCLLDKIHSVKSCMVIGVSSMSMTQCVCVRAKSLQSCLTLCDPRDGSPPGSSVHGILQARILE